MMPLEIGAFQIIGNQAPSKSVVSFSFQPTKLRCLRLRALQFRPDYGIL